MDDLPPILAKLVPEIEGAWPAESLATCASCPMHVRGRTPAERALQFTAAANCCTYHPSLSNFLVGRALRRADQGSVRVLRRLSDPRGVTPMGIFPNEVHLAQMNGMEGPDSATWFGRSTLVCPYWDGKCSIYPDRNHVCRTWFCKHEDGVRGGDAWHALREVMSAAEVAVAERCVAAGQPPPADAPKDRWVAWFLWCARHVDALEDPTGLDAALAPMRASLAVAMAEREGPMPEILIPYVQSHEPLDGELLFSSYSGYHREKFPSSTFQFLARLDGQTSWRTALAAHEDPALDEGVVVRMWRFGHIHRPEARVWKHGWDMGPELEGLIPVFRS